jgi:3-deoxy-D-manno-octulosonic-acid transferase
LSARPDLSLNLPRSTICAEEKFYTTLVGAARRRGLSPAWRCFVVKYPLVFHCVAFKIIAQSPIFFQHARYRRGESPAMRLLYNILFTIFFVLSSPYYFLRMQRRGNWQRGFGQRLGRFDSKFKQAITNRQRLWIHAVSVGEVGVCTQLIRELEPRLPNIKIIVSTTTTTGMEELEKRLPSHISRIYYPIDYRRCVSRALNTVRPEAIILVESEIWPNFIWKAHDMGVALFLVNARLSQRSFPRYRRFGFLFRRLFASFDGVGAQNEVDADRLRELGCRPDSIHVVGSLKFDAAKLDERRRVDVPEMLRQMAVGTGAKILVAGSTHAGEEALLADLFVTLRKRFPDLFLILVPRHFERSRDVARELESRGIPFVYRTELTRSLQYKPGEAQCLLVNTTGELKYFYQQATVIFIGKSLTAQGGQNPIEPGALGKPMVFGPNMQNFAEVVRSFLEKDGAVQVRDAGELEKTVGDLLADEARRQQLGRNALQVVRDNQGAIERTVDMVVQTLDGSGLYVAPK